MATFYSGGSLKIEIEPDGMTDDRRERFKGRIVLSDGREWRFEDLCSGVGGCSSEMEIAESALSFGSYYSTHNRGDDVPEWAPEPEIADAIDEQMDFPPEALEGSGESEEGDAYFGSYAIFTSLEAQRRWYELWASERRSPSPTE